MSNKGAIKKIPATKETLKSNVRSKLKNVPSIEDSESPGRLKKHQSVERGDGDKAPRSTQIVQQRKSVATRSVNPLNKSVKENTLPTMTKSGGTKTTSKIRPDATKKSSSSSLTTSNKPARRSQGSSERGGLSTIYVPQSTESKLSTKSVDRNRRSMSKDKEKVQKSNVSGGTNSKSMSRERKLSRTLSPSEIKILHSASSQSALSRKAGQSKRSSSGAAKNKVDAQGNVEDEYDYEDDFEDYESDFEKCTDSDTSQISEASSNSTSLEMDPIELRTVERRKTVNSAEHQKEEEHMHDSGHYELAEARKRAAKIESIIVNQSKPAALIELRQPVNKAYSEDRPSENKSLLSTDEGFEDSRSGDFTKSPPLSQISIIDFRKSKENQGAKKPKKTRGQELLEMIKLDVMEWSLFECTPIPYEEFIRTYGKLNTQQTSTQTGEDNIDTETQTDEIMLQSKWTQFPITCRTNLRTKEDLDLFRMDQIGAGSDTETVKPLLTPSFDVLRLNEFLNRAGRVMLSLLEERRYGGNVFQNEQPNLPFSDGVVRLSMNSVTFLTGRAVSLIHYSETVNRILLTIHSPVEEEIETDNKQDYITDCCIGCAWNISEPSMPVKLFYSACPITACCFHLTNYNVVLAGLQDGSISLWNLTEDEMWHQKVVDKANELDWTIRSPTYTTAANADVNTHNSSIVAIRILSKLEDTSTEKRSSRFVPIQMCSLDEEGFLVIWSVLHTMGVNVDDLGLSYWGDIRIIKSQEVPLKLDNGRTKISTAAFVDMRVDCVDTNNLYVATNTTSILHATCIGNKTNPAIYDKFDTSVSGNATCIETCPFERSFFLVGCDDGTIRLHSLDIEKPLLQLKDEEYSMKVRAVQWSKSKPFTVYALDSDSRICIWDLNNSDVNPTHVVDLKKHGRISSMQLSSCKTARDMAHQYLALGTESGNIEVHKLRTNFCYSKKEEYLQELNTFMRYVAIL